jgi:hypothetical protein
MADQPSNVPRKVSCETRDIVDEVMGEIRESLRGLRFGSVNIIVQDGVIIQIDRTDKRRLRGRSLDSGKTQ